MKKNPLFLNLLKYNQRVKWLYDNFKEAVEDDDGLITKYLEYFGSCKFKEATIKRAGRYLRMKNPEKYRRSIKKQERDAKLEEYHRSFYRK